MRAVLILALVAAAACTSQTGLVTNEPGLKEYRVAITENGYVPDKFEADAGDTLRFIVYSVGAESHRHGLAIDALSISEVAGTAAAPKTIEIQPSAGTYEIYCLSCRDGDGGSHPQLKATLVVG